MGTDQQVEEAIFQQQHQLKTALQLQKKHVRAQELSAGAWLLS